jgi:hypothetical protein
MEDTVIACVVQAKVAAKRWNFMVGIRNSPHENLIPL